MEIRITLVDAREKRWYSKVAHAAARAVNELIGPIGGEQRFEIHAHFDSSESNGAKIIDYTEKGVSCTQVFFYAKDWQTVTDSVPDATAQLASAILTLAPSGLRSQLSDFLAEKLTLVPVHRSSRCIQGDGLIDFYLYIDEPIEVDRFFAIIDRIDGELSKHNAGEVSGNAFGVISIGSCIDLVGRERAVTQKIAEEIVQASGIKQYRFEP